jgi:sigma-E factor negative regulatory protein RseC
MEERGVVIDSGNGKARVRIARTQECEGCRGCLYSESGRYMIAEAVDRLGVSAGDRVRLQTEGTSVLKDAAMLLLLPVVLLAAGYLAGSALAPALGIPGAAQGAGFLLGAVCFFGTFGVLLLMARRRPGSQAERSVIVEILAPEQDKGA